MKYLVLATAMCVGPVSAQAQIADVSVEIVEHFADRSVRIVEHFEDERWQVVGACSSSPDETIEIVAHFEDLRVKIVDHFPDRTVCISRADRLDGDTRRMLHLTD
jgi:hypothetical protein